MFVLCAADVGRCTSGQESGGEDLRAELIREKRFHSKILSAGVDGPCLRQPEGDISACLKWILLEGGEFRVVERGAEAASVSVGGGEYNLVSSRNDKFLVLLPVNRSLSGRDWTACRALFDWSGAKLWQMAGTRARPYVWNDRSTLFLHGRPKEPIYYRLEEMVFYDPKGDKTNEYRFLEPQYLLFRGVGLGDNHVAVASNKPAVYVFDKTGNLAWKQEQFRDRYNDGGTEVPYDFVDGVTVSSRGEVLVWLSAFGPWNALGLVFDAQGALRDTLLLRHAGGLTAIQSDDRLAFISVGKGEYGVSYLLCYDFAEMRLRFVAEEHDGGFGPVSVDQDAGLVAASVYRRNGTPSIEVLDLEGNLECRADFGLLDPLHCWFGLFGRHLVTAEGDLLRLYRLTRD